MDIAKLRSFCSVAKRLSYKEASDLLGSSDVAIRKQVLSLEKSVGYKLIKTIKQRLVLTRHGEIFLGSAQKILSQFENSLIELRDENSARRMLRVNTTQSIAACWLPPIIAGFAETDPTLSLSVVASDLEPDLKSGEADIAIRPTISASSVGCEKFFLVSYRLNLFASKEYLQRFGVPKTAEDLVHHRLISFGLDVPKPYEEINWHLHILRRHVVPYMTINSGAGILLSVQSGIGIGSLSRTGVEMSQSPLVRVLPDLDGPLVKAFFFVASHLTDSKRIMAFYKYLKDKLEVSEQHSSYWVTKSDFAQARVS